MEKVKIRNINSRLEQAYDIFICSTSFEKRCISIPQKICRKKINKIILLENIKGSDFVKENADILRALFPKRRKDILVNFDQIKDMANTFIKELSIEGKRTANTVLIDITTFTHEELLICMKVLLTSNKVKSITCVYNNAFEYCPGVEMDKKWLSQGAKLLHPVLGYPGTMLPTKKTHLVIITGYEYSRAFSAISDVEPSSISLVYGSSNSSLTEKDQEANTIFKNMVEKMAFEYNEIEEYEIPCNDPDAIADGLTEIYNLHSDMNILVIPLNSKMSTLGVIKSLGDNEEPQVCYAPALLYNESNYSVPGNDCYIYKIK